MDRQEFADDFVVEPTHLGRLQDDIETDRRRLLADLLGVGIAWGLELTQTPSPGLSLRIAPGVAYTAAGRRIEIGVAEDADLSLDYLGASTAPLAGQERYVALYLHPTRTESEPWTDPLSVVRNLRAVESYSLRVVAGASASPGAAVVPGAVDPDDVLLGRVLRAEATTAFYTVDVRLVNVARAARAADLRDESVERAFEVAPTDPPSLSVVVGPGRCRINGEEVQRPAATIGPFTLPASGMTRVDLVYANAGGIYVRAGTEVVSGSGVSYPNTRGTFPIAFVALEAGQAAILPEHILDARPFLDLTLPQGQSHRVVAAAAQSAFSLPWSYEAGAGAIAVYLDGVRLDSTQIVENGGTLVSLVTPASGGEVFTAYSTDVPPPSARIALERIEDDLSGMLEWRGCFTADRTGWKVVIPPIRACVIDRVRRFTEAETLVLAVLLAPGVQYLYAKPLSTTGLDFEITSTPPDAEGLWKSGTTTHRYLALLVVNSSGDVYGFRKHPSGLYVWRLGMPDVLADICTQPIATGGWTPLSLGAAVSPVARLVRGEVSAEPSTGGELVGVRARDTTGDGVTLTSAATERMRLTVDLEVNDLGQIDVRSTCPTARFIVHEFWE